MHCFVSPPTNMLLSVTIIKSRVIVQSGWNTVIYICHFYLQYLSAARLNKIQRVKRRRISVFCNENSPYHSPLVCLSFLSLFLCLASSRCQHHSEQREAWQADWPLTWLIWEAPEALLRSLFEARSFSVTWHCLHLPTMLLFYLTYMHRDNVRTNMPYV